MNDKTGPAWHSESCPVVYPFRGEHRLELEREYADARRHGRLLAVTLPVGGDAWLASTHVHVKAVLASPRLARQPANQPSCPRLSEGLLPSGSLPALDGEAHGRLRRHIAKIFTARHARTLEVPTQAAADRLLDALEASAKPVDLVSQYAEPITTATTSEILGLPQGIRDEVLVLSEALTRPSTPNAHASDRARLEDLLDAATHEDALPVGLLNDLADSRTRPEPLTLAEMADLVLAVYAGGRTPALLLSSAVHLLLTRPKDLGSLRADPSLWDTAVDELLRFIPVGLSGGFPRIATEDVDVCGSPVPEGQAVLPATIAANFDEEVFADAYTFDLSRHPNPHLAFGYGPHRCPGAPVTRILVEVALRTLFTRFPGLRFSGGRSVAWQQGQVVRGLSTLPVEW